MGEKDVLEFPLEKLEIPLAIILMMQAAYRTGYEGERVTTHEERVQLLSEKLEARVEDSINAAKAVREEPAEEDEPNRFEPVDGRHIHLVIEDEVIKQVVVDGVLFNLTCNQRVKSGGIQEATYCMKQWGHKAPEHEDMEGNYR
jgi:hypothetical protein